MMSSLSKSLRADKKAYRESVMMRLCSEINYEARTSKNGKVIICGCWNIMRRKNLKIK